MYPLEKGLLSKKFTLKCLLKKEKQFRDIKGSGHFLIEMEAIA
jgi:hypothetical protein